MDPPTSPFEIAAISELSSTIVTDMNRPQCLDTLEILKLDALLVCVCSNILKKEVLSISNMHFINVHPSLLPKYRGPAPAFWMRYNNEPEAGVTFHLMSQRIDQGNIVKQFKMQMNRTHSEHRIEIDAFKLTAEVERVLRNFVEEEGQNTIRQDQAQASYFSFPTRENRKELKNKLPIQKVNRTRSSPTFVKCSIG